MDIEASVAALKQGPAAERERAHAELIEAGESAFDRLVAAIEEVESDADAVRELSRTFVKLRAGVPLRRYADALRHPSGRVRSDAAYVLELVGPEAAPYVEDLLPLLADSDVKVRRSAMCALGQVGDGAVLALRRVRRYGPGRLRKAALEALADIAGEDGLDDRDRLAVQRLIQIKLVREVPLAPHLCGSWLSVRTGDQRALMAALDLSDPRPATMALGFSAVNNDQHRRGNSFETRRGRIFVTPQFGEWTLVFGGWSAVPGDYVRDAIGTCEMLSRQFGAAHAYGASCGDGWTTWCIAEHGSVRRFYEADNPDVTRGDRLPVEQGRLLPDQYDAYTDEFWRDVHRHGVTSVPPETWVALKRKHQIPDDVNVLDVAAAMSVDPGTFGPDTRFRGHGVLTLNQVGRQYGVCPGALAI